MFDLLSEPREERHRRFGRIVEVRYLEWKNGKRSHYPRALWEIGVKEFGLSLAEISMIQTRIMGARSVVKVRQKRQKRQMTQNK